MGAYLAQREEGAYVLDMEKRRSGDILIQEVDMHERRLFSFLLLQ